MLPYLQADAGRPILCLNGIGMPADIAGHLEPFMSRAGLACLSPEWRGAWPAVVGTWPRLRRMAGVLARLLDHVGVARLPVLGHSWGGALAQEFARRHPDRVSHLILANTTAGAFMLPGKLDGLFEFLSPGLYRTGPGRNARRSQLRRLPSVDAKLAGWQFTALNGWTSIHWLHRLNMPTLLIAGERDSLVRPVNVKIVASRLPHGELHWVPGGSHMCLYTRADELVPRIASFVGSGSGGGDAPHRQ
jgi:pimeloyl-ACP methyl ester carboxylesterase